MANIIGVWLQWQSTESQSGAFVIEELGENFNIFYKIHSKIPARKEVSLYNQRNSIYLFVCESLL